MTTEDSFNPGLTQLAGIWLSVSGNFGEGLLLGATTLPASRRQVVDEWRLSNLSECNFNSEAMSLPGFFRRRGAWSFPSPVKSSWERGWLAFRTSPARFGNQVTIVTFTYLQYQLHLLQPLRQCDTQYLTLGKPKRHIVTTKTKRKSLLGVRNDFFFLFVCLFLRMRD